MDALTQRAYELMLGGTNMLVDNKRNVLLLRSSSNGERAEVMRMILAKRRSWLNYLTVTQRRWQDNRRTVTPRSCAIRKAQWGNRHDDATILRAEQESVTTRERYVRCTR